MNSKSRFRYYRLADLINGFLFGAVGLLLLVGVFYLLLVVLVTWEYAPISTSEVGALARADVVVGLVAGVVNAWSSARDREARAWGDAARAYVAAQEARRERQEATEKPDPVAPARLT